MDRLQMLIRILVRDRLAAAAPWHPKNISVLAIASDVRADHAVRALAAVLQNCRARAIAEKDAGVTVGPVRNRGKFLGADHEHRLVGVGGDELLRNLQRKKETGAG